MKIAIRLAIAAAVVALIATATVAQEVNWITKEELKDALGSTGLTVIDVRTSKDWENSDVMIKGAVRENPANVSAWAANYPRERRLVLY